MITANAEYPAPLYQEPGDASLPVAALARSVASGELSAIDLAERAIERLSEIGPRLAALAYLNAEQARSDARRADDRAAIEQEHALVGQPLLGVPLSVKEGLKVARAPWMMGSSLNRTRIADADGSVVASLRNAGAVIAGLGAMAEMALWPETINRLTGRALHPRDARRTPGGSSGGDAALVASGAVPAAVGADGGGSVRIPAAYCGLFGHKPSAGMVPLDGHVPMDRGPETPTAALARYFSPGPMCRNAADLWPILCVMAEAEGYQARSERLRPRDLPAPSPSLIAGKSVFVLPCPQIRGAETVDAAQIAAVERAATVLEQYGARLRSARTDLLRDAFWVWMGTLRCAAEMDLERLLGNGARLRLLPEIAAQLRGGGRHTSAGLLLAFCARIDPTGPRFWRSWAARGQALRAELEAMLADDGLLLCPPVPGPAPTHDHAFRHPFNIAACAVFNVLGNPASVAPVLDGPEGMPRAVQIVARHNADHLTVSTALALSERSFHA